jgi:hypothetical protein
MLLKRMLGTVTAIAALTVAVVLYTVHPVKSSDHQDTYNLATSANGHNTSADITDVYVFPAPDNANNVVFAMNVSPLIPPGMGTSYQFDPTLLWQFKISHTASGVEDQTIQMTAAGTGTGQVLSLYGPAAPAQVGTTNTIVGTPIGTTAYNNSQTFANGVKFFAGPRTDPFVFDLFAFFTFAGDRNYGTHTGQNDPGSAPGSPNAPALGTNGNSASNISSLTPAYDKAGNPGGPSFNGFASGAMSTSSGGSGGAFGSYACSTNPASDILDAGPFNVLSYVVEVPKSLINAQGSTIHVWATVSSASGS